MSCAACGHDWCDGSCPPNMPLVYETCIVCGNTEELDDLDEYTICHDCNVKGYTRQTSECEQCGLILGKKEFAEGWEPFKRIEVRGLTRTYCPDCAGKVVA